ncbi:hypothetical protein Csa_008539 [Cucumis sativus]|uniref:Transmembrane protein n=1 Tax=Cucumis sativus TaxID=3659 RepID=A0A0A0KP61_CUCSA|nr:hypothetical protein Csa_008539 [Cucumis sativus]
MAQRVASCRSSSGLLQLFAFLFIFFLLLTVPGCWGATKFVRQKCRRVENWVSANKNRKGRITHGSMHGDYEDTINMSPIHHN